MGRPKKTKASTSSQENTPENPPDETPPADSETKSTLDNTLNSLFSGLMSSVPNDIKAQADVFIKEVAGAVNSVLDNMEKKVVDADNRVKSLEARMVSSGKSGDKPAFEDEMFLLKSYRSVEGTWPTLFRVTDPAKPLFCIRYKKHPEQPVVCGAQCAGLKILSDGSVELCNGSVRKIVRES